MIYYVIYKSLRGEDSALLEADSEYDVRRFLENKKCARDIEILDSFTCVTEVQDGV